MTTMTMIISKIRFDKTVSSCPGKNSPCKREDNTRPRSSRRGDFFPLLVQRKLLFFSFLFWRHIRRVGKGTRCSSLCRRIHRLRVARQWKPWEYSSRRGRTMGRASLPPPPFGILNHFHGRNKGLLPPTGVSYTYSAPFVARFYVEMLRGEIEREREGRNIPSPPLFVVA